MRAILLATQPQHVCNIMNELKTDEIRKSVPKNFRGDVYIYCTKGKLSLARDTHNGKYTYRLCNGYFSLSEVNLNGKIVAKFTLNTATEIGHIVKGVATDENYEYSLNNDSSLSISDYLNRACLTFDEVLNYMGNSKHLYAWHIDNLVVFDKPMELGEFRTLKLKEDCRKCGYYEDLGGGSKTCYYNREAPRVKKCYAELTRPPQSYQFVEVSE